MCKCKCNYNTSYLSYSNRVSDFGIPSFNIVIASDEHIEKLMIHLCKRPISDYSFPIPNGGKVWNYSQSSYNSQMRRQIKHHVSLCHWGFLPLSSQPFVTDSICTRKH